MAERDELTPALRRTWNKRLAGQGFRRVGRRDLQRVSNGIVHLFNFQVSRWGSRNFCVNVAAFTLCGSETPVLQPGFRLHHANGADMWLPSCAASEAAESVEIAWKAAEMQALTWFERNQTLEGHLQVLRTETSADHHQHLQMGIVEAMLGKRDNAIGYLITACGLYAKDGRAWCPAYIDRAKALIDALARGEEGELLEQWRVANLAVHRIKSS